MMRLGGSVFLAYSLTGNSFEDIFSQVSLLSSVLIIFSASNVSIKNKLLQKHLDYSLDDGINYLKTFEIVLGILFLVLAWHSEIHVIAIILVITRFIETLEEFRWEIVNKPYAIRFKVFGEMIVILCVVSHLFDLKAWLLLPIIVVAQAWFQVKKKGSFLSATRLFRANGLKKEGIFLEFNGVIFFGLDLFIMALFLSSSQFMIYFFIQRIFGSLNLLHGMMSRNFWAQAVVGGEGEKFAISQTNRSYLALIIYIGLFFSGMLALMPYVIGYWPAGLSIVDFSFLKEMVYEFFFLCIMFNFACFIIVSLNRFKKINFQLKIDYSKWLTQVL